MGVHPNITDTRFPKQSDWVKRRVEVVFHYGDQRFPGTILRDDTEAPGETIIALDDGRVVRAVECQYRLPT